MTWSEEGRREVAPNRLVSRLRGSDFERLCKPIQGWLLASRIPPSPRISPVPTPSSTIYHATGHDAQRPRPLPGYVLFYTPSFLSFSYHRSLTACTYTDLFFSGPARPEQPSRVIGSMSYPERPWPEEPEKAIAVQVDAACACFHIQILTELWRMLIRLSYLKFGHARPGTEIIYIRKIPSKLPRAWKRMRNIKLLGTEW